MFSCARTAVAYLLLSTATHASDWTGVYTYVDWTTDYRFYGMSSSNRQPIFQGGRIRRNLEAAQAAFTGALAEYKKAALNGYREVSNALVTIQKLDEVRGQRCLRCVRVATGLAFSSGVCGIRRPCAGLRRQRLPPRVPYPLRRSADEVAVVGRRQTAARDEAGRTRRL